MSYRLRVCVWLGRLGRIVGALGALAALAGGAMPWLTFPMFGVTVTLPGVVVGGAGAAAAGAAALAVGRRWPWLVALLGIAPLLLAQNARRTLGREVVRRQLQVEMRLNPVNQQLARVGVPPLTVFPKIERAAAYLGGGIAWALWGGLGMVGGGALTTWATWRRGTCRRCGAHWREARLGELRHCPRCGESADPTPACSRCFGPLERSDRFCIRCGAPVAASALPDRPNPV